MNFKQVVFDKEKDIKLDIYDADSDVALPGIVILPGGSYKTFQERDAARVALTFLTKSYQAFVVEYPVNDKKNYQDAKQSIDLAFNYITKNAKDLNVDPEKLGIIGFSAGGQLAAAYSNQSATKAKFTILGYPVLTQALDEKIGIQSEDVTKQVTKNTPPTFIFGARGDELAPYIDHIYPYTEALYKNGVNFEVHLFATGGHGFSLANKFVGVVNRDRTDNHFAKWFPLCLEWLQSL